MATYYMLDEEHHVVPTSSVLAWGEWFETTNLRQVGLTKVGDRVISTVFLGIDYRHFGDGPPLLFETMVKSGEEGWGDEVRYSSWDDAEAGHKATVRRCEHEASWVK